MLSSTGLNTLMSTFAMSNTVADVYETATYSCNAVQNLKSYTMNQLSIQSSRIAATSNTAYGTLYLLSNYALSNGQSNWNFASNASVWASNYFKKFGAYVDIVEKASGAIAYASNSIAKCAFSNDMSNWNWASNNAASISKQIKNCAPKEGMSNWDWASNTVNDVAKSLSTFALAEYQHNWEWASNTSRELQKNTSNYALQRDTEHWVWGSNMAAWSSNRWKAYTSNIDYASNMAFALSNSIVPALATYWSITEPGHEGKMFTTSNVVVARGKTEKPGAHLLHVDGLARAGALVVDSSAPVMYLKRGFYLNFMSQFQGEVRYCNLSGFEEGGHVWGKFQPRFDNITMDDFVEQMRLTGDGGFLGIGLPKGTKPQAALHIKGDAIKSDGGQWWGLSDRRIKENIVDADTDICYENVKNIPLRCFTWKHGHATYDKRKVGWIAQEVEQVLPKAVSTIDAYGINDCKTLNTDQIIAAMFGAIQKLQLMVEDLQAQAKADREAIAQLREL